MNRNPSVEVECSECHVRYMKRMDSLKNWSGACIRCIGGIVSRRPETRAMRSEHAKRQCAEGRGIVAIDHSKRRVRRGAEINTWRGGKPKCLDCGVELGGYLGKRCTECAGKARRGRPHSPEHRQRLREGARRGPNHPGWKGGKQRSTTHAAYQEWRLAVFRRDRWTCQICGDHSRKGHYPVLHAHHLAPVVERPDLAHEMTNGQTLCAPCHRKTDSYGVKVFRRKAG
jgi:5-methylcytosine-specific restriction endonuclease McrA